MLRSEGLRVRTIALAAVLAAALTAMLVLWGARSAEATFPGTNGKIVFVSNGITDDNPTGDNEIFTMNANGTGVAQQTFNSADDNQPTWSADGTQIAFSSNRTAGPNVDNPTGDHEIFTMPPDGQPPDQIQLTHNAMSDTEPAWSPALSSGGTKIAFTTFRSDQFDIYVMSSNGSNVVRLTKNPKVDGNPAWSPNGKKIAFASDRSGNSEIYVMKPRPEGRRNRPVKLTRHSSFDRSPGWSPDGTQIVFDSFRGVSGDSEIYRMDSDGTDQVPLTENQMTDFKPVWSPDGAWIAFTRLDTNSATYEIYKMSTNGSNLDNLTENSTHDFAPDWQPIVP